MAFDPALAERIRAALSTSEDVSERKMFGGLAFSVGGQLAVSAYRDGGLMIRCAGATWQSLVQEPGARPMVRKGKPVSGWILVSADAVAEDASLARWLERGVTFARSQAT